jgi:hypothetical protein
MLFTLPSRLTIRRLSMMVLFSTLLAACGGNDEVAVLGTAPPPPAPAPGPAPAPAPVPINIGTASTGTGAFGVLGTANERVAFVPAGTLVLPITLESKSAAPPATAGKAGITLSFTIDACSVDSNDLKAICIGYNSNKIAMLDLRSFATSLKVSDITAVEFASGAPTTSLSFSGGSCVLCGVSADVGKSRFVVGGSGGYRVFNYSNTTTAAATYNFPVGENFALLPRSGAASYVIAPEYEPNGGNRKLRVINLDNGKAYVWNKSTDNLADLGPDGSSFTSTDIDAAAVDLATGMIVLAPESGADMLMIDFGQASFNEGSLTFAAPHSVKKPLSSVNRQTDVSVSTKDSLLLTHGEFSASIGVMQLPTATGTAGLFPSNTATLGVLDLNDSALSAARTVCSTSGTSSFTFSGKGDPHGLSLFTGLDSSQRGLVIDSNNTCAAIVDLKGLSTAARKATAAANIDTAAPGFVALVKFVKLQ